MRTPKTMIGWEEWCGFPDLGLPAIKAKVDTGAKTSALHAYDIEPFEREGTAFVRFKIHPLQKNKMLEVQCEAPVADFRGVTSSNGERDRRYVIKTPMVLGEKVVDAEVTLTSRHKMTFRMLLGRDAIKQAKFVVDPAKSYLLGKKSDVEQLYHNTGGTV